MPDRNGINAIEAGHENVVEIPLVLPSIITGLVREQGTGEPVAGVQASLSQLGRQNHDRAETDDEGRFTLRGLPGKVRFSLLWPPTTHIQALGQHWEDFTLPEEPTRIELKPQEVLRAASPLRGIVRDEAGQPVAGASVRGQWRASLPSGNLAGSSVAMADEQGEFSLESIAPGARVTITARLHDRATLEPLAADVETDQPVHITIVPRATLAVAGRVLGPKGEPVAGATVRLWSREVSRDPNQPTPFGRPLGLEDNAQIRTGPDGSFQTSKELDREGLEYQAEINAESFHPARTPWLPTGAGDVLTLPELTLRRVRTIRDISGRIVDREGRPLAGALVFQAGDGPKRSETTTGGDGTFRLPGVYSGPALVFAEKAGFRFGGAIVGPKAEAVEVRLARIEEPPIARLKTLPPAMERAEERALARELIEPVLPLERSGLLGRVSDRVIPALARVDPGAS